MKLAYSGFIALVVALLELSLLPVMLDIGGKSIGTITLLFYAFLVGSVTSLIVSYYMNRMQGIIEIVKSRKVFGVIVIAGLLNDVISQLFLGIGTVGTNPIIGATIFRTWVIIAALFVPLTLKQKVDKIQYIATIIGFLGVYVLATNGSFISINLADLPFILILFGSALCTVYPNLAMKKYNVDTLGLLQYST